MIRINLLYAVCAGLVIFSFFSFLGSEKVTGAMLLKDKTEHEWILNQWVVAEAVDLKDGEDVTSRHSSEVWYFLKSKGFVLFNNQIIEKNGSWELKNDTLQISTEGLHKAKNFHIEKTSRNEMVILNGDLKIRLLKLESEEN